MQINHQLNQNTQIQDFVDLERYAQGKPAIYNKFYQANLIELVDKFPSLPKINQNLLINEQKENNCHQQNMKIIQQQRIEEELQNTKQAYKHQFDRLNQDIQINDYVFTNNLLGRGAHSTVRLAKQGNSVYAVKILWFQKIRKKYFINQKQLTKMVNTQINILKKYKHENIIGFKQAIYSNEKQKIFVILQYCKKGCLLKLFQNMKICCNQWWQIVHRYFQQLVEGVYYLHSQNIIHRDIKSQNLLIDQSDTLKIIDFNVSQILNQDAKLKVNVKFIGTKSYAAPQLLLDLNKEKIVNGKAVDIWAMGITLLQLLERKHPFSVQTLQELHKKLKEKITFNPKYSDDLKDLLQRMLTFENEARISIEEILKHKWLCKNQ